MIVAHFFFPERKIVAHLSSLSHQQFKEHATFMVIRVTEREQQSLKPTTFVVYISPLLSFSSKFFSLRLNVTKFKEPLIGICS